MATTTHSLAVRAALLALAVAAAATATAAPALADIRVNLPRRWQSWYYDDRGRLEPGYVVSWVDDNAATANVQLYIYEEDAGPDDKVATLHTGSGTDNRNEPGLNAAKFVVGAVQLDVSALHYEGDDSVFYLYIVIDCGGFFCIDDRQKQYIKLHPRNPCSWSHVSSQCGYGTECENTLTGGQQLGGRFSCPCRAGRKLLTFDEGPKCYNCRDRPACHAHSTCDETSIRCNCDDNYNENAAGDGCEYAGEETNSCDGLEAGSADRACRRCARWAHCSYCLVTKGCILSVADSDQCATDRRVRYSGLCPEPPSPPPPIVAPVVPPNPPPSPLPGSARSPSGAVGPVPSSAAAVPAAPTKELVPASPSAADGSGDGDGEAVKEGDGSGSAAAGPWNAATECDAVRATVAVGERCTLTTDAFALTCTGGGGGGGGDGALLSLPSSSLTVASVGNLTVSLSRCPPGVAVQTSVTFAELPSVLRSAANRVGIELPAAGEPLPIAKSGELSGNATLRVPLWGPFPLPDRDLAAGLYVTAGNLVQEATADDGERWTLDVGAELCMYLPPLGHFSCKAVELTSVAFVIPGGHAQCCLAPALHCAAAGTCKRLADERAAFEAARDGGGSTPGGGGGGGGQDGATPGSGAVRPGDLTPGGGGGDPGAGLGIDTIAIIAGASACALITIIAIVIIVCVMVRRRGGRAPSSGGPSTAMTTSGAPARRESYGSYHGGGGGGGGERRSRTHSNARRSRSASRAGRRPSRAPPLTTGFAAPPPPAPPPSFY